MSERQAFADDEYLRRNMNVARAIGIRSAALEMRRRLIERKRKPEKWLLYYVDSIIERIDYLPKELAKFRDESEPEAAARYPDKRCGTCEYWRDGEYCFALNIECTKDFFCADWRARG